MFKQKTTDSYDRRKKSVQVTLQVTLSTKERYSEQTYVEPRQDQYYNSYGYAPSSERNIQWDWYSLLGFIFPFIILMLPAGIASIGLVSALVFFFSTNFYVNLFFLYFFFGIVYASSVFLFLNTYNLQKTKIYTLIFWLFYFPVAFGGFMLFLSIFNMLDFIFFPTFSLPDFGWWMLYLIYLLVYSILNVFIQLKWLTVIYDWLYDKFEKYGKRLGLLKEYSSIYSRY